ncbi:hypothetical protein, partial [Nocardia cyriacigeorgica]|uniref:hypothetical protein n=1 Tax=Nocardia cyriacigeorgica TaxID=135487 RepID=UPI002458631C
RRKGFSATPRLVLASGTIRALAAAIDTGAGAEHTVATAGYGPVGPTPRGGRRGGGGDPAAGVSERCAR